MNQIIQAVITGLLIGGVFGLFAMGLSLVFGVMKVINFAHGDFVMLAMYSSFFLYQWFHLDPLISLPITILILVLVGVVSYLLIFRRLVGMSDMPQFLGAIGLSLFIQNTAQLAFSPASRTVTTAYSRYLSIGRVFINEPQLIAFVVALALTGALALFLARSDMGKAMRATVDDSGMAQMLGINPQLIFVITFGLGAILAAISGAILVTYYPATPTVGSQFLILGFAAIVLGGIGNVMGSFVGGLLIGVVQQVSAVLISQDLQNATVFLIFILVLIVRPSGLFGRAEVR